MEGLVLSDLDSLGGATSAMAKTNGVALGDNLHPKRECDCDMFSPQVWIIGGYVCVTDRYFLSPLPVGARRAYTSLAYNVGLCSTPKKQPAVRAKPGDYRRAAHGSRLGTKRAALSARLFQSPPAQGN